MYFKSFKTENFLFISKLCSENSLKVSDLQVFKTLKIIKEFLVVQFLDGFTSMDFLSSLEEIHGLKG